MSSADVVPQSERSAAESKASRASHCILLAGGGTGGHISPGLAIAERLRSLDPSCRPIFACSTRPIDAAMLRDADAEFIPIPAEPFSLSPGRLIRCLRAGWAGRRIATSILRDAGVEHVVALGGFVTFPVVAAAEALDVPILLVNLDATPGKANRFAAKRANRIYSAVPTPGVPDFADRIIGMPIRRVAIAPSDPVSCRELLGLKGALPTLLVTGASQGATSLNNLMVELLRRRREAFEGWQVYHLCGQGNREALAKTYADAGVPARVETFLHRMGLAWGAADLALSRAGANSVAEAAANAVPTLFAPYPHHADLHQQHNAQPLVDEGCAAMELDLVEPAANAARERGRLGQVLVRLMTDSAERTAMRKRLQGRPREDAAMTIARGLLGLG